MAPDKEFITLVDRNKGIIYKVACSYCSTSQDRDDLAQEIVYNLWKSFRSYDSRYKFSTWMYRIALNVAISFFRKEKARINTAELPQEILIVNEDGDSEKDINLQVLETFIHELREMDRAIILLYLEEKPYREISEITGFTETNISTRINRIKELLRKKFKTARTSEMQKHHIRK